VPFDCIDPYGLAAWMDVKWSGAWTQRLQADAAPVHLVINTMSPTAEHLFRIELYVVLARGRSAFAAAALSFLSDFRANQKGYLSYCEDGPTVGQTMSTAVESLYRRVS